MYADDTTKSQLQSQLTVIDQYIRMNLKKKKIRFSLFNFKFIKAQDSLGKVNGKRGIGRTCPHQFFPVDDNDPNTPCYHISLVPNYRKNWEV